MFALSAALLVAAAMAGCGADMSSAIVTGGATAAATAGSGAGTGAGSAYSGAGATKPVFDPFQRDGFNEAPRREVIANPTLAQVLQPGPLPEFSLGRADAPVVMVKYMSLTCQYCRRFMAETFPVFKREYIDTGKVRLIIREFPIGKTSGNATIALRCAPMAKYLSLYQKFLQKSGNLGQPGGPPGRYL